MKLQKRLKSWGEGKLTFLLAAGFLAVAADDLKVGYREITGVSVESGATATQSGRVDVLPQGRLLKIGGGTLSMPLEAIESRVPSKVEVLDGTLELTAGAVAPRDVNNPPSVIAEKAAFWVDATAGKGLVSTNGEADAETGVVPVFAARWCDRRETNPASPTLLYAEAWWTNSTSSALWGVPPAVETIDGRRTVYFGGKNSSQCMMFMKNGALSAVTGVYDAFAVFGVTNCLGLVLGTYGEKVSTFFLTTIQTWPNIKYINYARHDVGPSSYSSRFYLDGAVFDPYYTGPKRGFQLYERHRFDSLGDSNVQAFFTGYANPSASVSACDGGDYLSEVILFTNRLSDAERLDVERYLMAKWDLPHVKDGKLPMQRQYRAVSVAAGATLEVSANSGEIMDEIQLSGEGTVVKKGEGVMAVGPSGDVPFTGTLDLQGGSVIARGARVPAVALTSGSRLNSKEVRYSSADPVTEDEAAQASAATTVTLHSDAASGMAVKDGPGPARVRSIADGVKKLKVEAGQLVLDAGVVSSASPIESISATIPNHDFERPFTIGNFNSGDPYAQFGKLMSDSGWTSMNNGVLLTTIPSSKGDKWGTWLSNPCPQGTNVLYIIAGGGAYTTVTFPVSGYYHGSVLVSVRSRGAQQYSPVDVFLGKTLQTTNLIGTIVGGHNGAKPEDFRRHYFRTPYVEAGVEYVFGVKSRFSPDHGMAFDDFRMDYLPGGERDEPAYKIPNGDFEQIGPISHIINLANGVTTAGWTLSDAGSDLTLPSTVVSSGRLFTIADVDTGSVQLMLASNAWAETTFTPPAGTYYLRGRMADWPSYWGFNRSQRGATVHATVTISGETTDLGSLAAGGHLLTQYVWPNPFTVDGATPVTLRLTQPHNLRVVLVDDLELVSKLPEGELLADPEVEDDKVWTALNPAAPRLAEGVPQGGGLKSNLGVVTGTTTPVSYYWGHNMFSGNIYMMLAENGGTQQSVTIPQAGTYRLTYHERSRVHNTGNGANPVRAWIRSADGSYTNFISRSTRYWSTNYYENAFLFSLPSAGNYVLAFQGTGYNWRTNPREDIETLIDGVSLRRVTDELVDVPSVPEKIRIEVANGAILALDFPGTLRTGSLKLGGTHVTGLVNSDTHPDYICGMGTIDARPIGCVLSIR